MYDRLPGWTYADPFSITSMPKSITELIDSGR